LVIFSAVVLALSGALLPVAPELTIALMSLLVVCCLAFSAGYAVFWLKHRPLPRDYDDKSKPKPNKIEGFLLAAFALWPTWFRTALDIPLWLCAAFAIALYFLGKLVLFRWWLPRKISR
jgi:hypothetical protein